MGNLRDITNKIFGDWKVIKFDNTKGKYKYYWICECIHCGHEKSIVSASLLNGKSLKCDNCNQNYKQPQIIKGYRENLIGENFGDLTVINFDHKENSHSYWKCKCKCGRYDVINVTKLKTGVKIKCKKCIEEEKQIIRKETFKENDKNKEIKDKIIMRKKYNNFYIHDNIVTIDDELIIDLKDLEKVKSINRAWYKNNSGYWLVTKNNEDIFLHRFLMDLPIRYDNETKLIADHINGNRSDNRRSNLRVIKKAINPINCKIYSNNTSGHKGVSWCERLNKWQTSININNKSIYLGVYTDFNKAVKIREQAEEKYFGEFNREEV